MLLAESLIVQKPRLRPHQNHEMSGAWVLTTIANMARSWPFWDGKEQRKRTVLTHLGEAECDHIGLQTSVHETPLDQKFIGVVSATLLPMDMAFHKPFLLTGGTSLSQ